MELFAERLLAWFDVHGRKTLPWQRDKSPYRIWVSEIMLQQTQVTTVIPYFERFMRAFPSVEALASATLDEVLHQWTGLGYYARARNLHATAQRIMGDYNGALPRTQQELESLPGIGRSTAAAIIAICHDQRATILDGNVKRVLARVFAIDGWPGQTRTLNELWQHAEKLTPEDRAADYTQAIMDLGATLCTRNNPQCDACPFSSDCRACQKGAIEQYPGRKPKKDKPVRQTTMLIIERDGEVLLEKRDVSGLWGGLWSFPETGNIDEYLLGRNLQADKVEELAPFRHTFTHFHLDIQPYRIIVKNSNRIEENGKARWYSLDNPPSLGLTRPVTRLLTALQSDTLFQ